MTLLNAPAYNARREQLTRNMVIGTLATVAVLAILTLAGISSAMAGSSPTSL